MSILAFFLQATGWLGFAALCLQALWLVAGLLWMLGRSWSGERIS